MNIQIIFEDNDILVINKPSGVSMHKDGKRYEYTIADWVLEKYPTLAEVGEFWTNQNGEKILRPGIVHRIDKETSGVVLIAKTQEHFLFLKDKFKNREIKKEYRAFVYGGFKDEKRKGVINKKIGRSIRFGVFNVEPHVRGTAREAITEYEVLGQTGESQEEDFAYLAVFPRTGRTHQIRVHLKSIHRPIVCDKLYAPKKQCAMGFERLALHAFSISFIDLSGKERKFIAKLPLDFENAITSIR